MKTVLFTIADSVELYEGKLVIVGVFDVINENTFPTTLWPVDLAIKLRADRAD